MKPVWQKTVHFLLAFLLICSNIQPVFARQIPETGTMSTCAMNSAGIRTRPGVTNSESQKERPLLSASSSQVFDHSSVQSVNPSLASSRLSAGSSGFLMPQRPAGRLTDSSKTKSGQTFEDSSAQNSNDFDEVSSSQQASAPQADQDQSEDSGSQLLDDEPWDGLYLVIWKIKKPGESDFKQVYSTRQSYHSHLKDYWVSQELAPLTLVDHGQLYVMTFWYDNPSLDKPCIIDLLWGDATFYASYVPASTITVTNYVNSTDSATLSQKYPIALHTQIDMIQAASGIVCLDDPAQQWTVNQMNQDFAANETKTFVVPKGEDITATQTDLSAQGFMQYGLKDKTLIPGLKVDAIIDADEGSPFNVVNSKSSYIGQPAFAYGRLEDHPQTLAGLGMAKFYSPEILEASLLRPGLVSNYYGTDDFSVDPPQQLKEYPAGFNQLDENKQVILHQDGQDWYYQDSAVSSDHDYFYTVTWTRAFLAEGVEAGSNDMYPASNQEAYRLEGEISRYVNVHFKVRLPGQTTFSDVSGHNAAAVKWNQPLSQLDFPDEKQLPQSTAWNDLDWQLTTWYDTPELDSSLDRSQQVDQAMTLYAAYIPVNPVYTYGQIINAQGQVEAWMGLGLASVQGIELPVASQAPQNVNLLDKAADIAWPDHYPTIRWQGENYTCVKSSPAPGQYCVKWKTLEARDEIIAGANQAYTPEARSAYWLIGEIEINPIRYEVQFVYQYPGQSGFTLLKTLTIESGRTIAKDQIPAPDDPVWIYQPRTRQAAIASAWSMDANGQQAADFSQPIQANTTFYKRYIPANRLGVCNINNSLLSDDQTLTINFSGQSPGLNAMIPEDYASIYGSSPFMFALDETSGRWQARAVRLNQEYGFYAPDNTRLMASIITRPDQVQTYFQYQDTIVTGTKLDDLALPANSDLDLLVITAQVPYRQREVQVTGILPDGMQAALGTAQGAAGPLIDPQQAASLVNYMDYHPQITKADSTYPALVWQGQTYVYAPPQSAQAAKPGFYTIDAWQSLTKDTSQNTARYVLEGKIRFNTYHLASFEIKMPGQGIFEDVAGYSDVKVLDGQKIQSAIPPASVIPPARVVDGITYAFDGWYTDPNLEQKASLDDLLQKDQVFYGQYVPVRRVFTLTEQTVSGNIEADPQAKFVFQIDFYPAGNEKIAALDGQKPDAPNSWHIELSSQQSIQFEIPDGTEFAITEISQQPELYATAWSVQTGDCTQAAQDSCSTGRLQAIGDVRVIFTNTRRGVVPSDFEPQNMGPWLGLTAGLLVLLALMFKKRHA